MRHHTCAGIELLTALLTAFQVHCFYERPQYSDKTTTVHLFIAVKSAVQTGSFLEAQDTNK